MDNDYLRVNSKSDDAEIVTSEFDVKKEQVKTEGPKKLTVMSILFSGRKKHGTSVPYLCRRSRVVLRLFWLFLFWRFLFFSLRL